MYPEYKIGSCVMSLLIDDVVKTFVKTHICINGKWYIAKPIRGPISFASKLKDAVKVFKGDCLAVHFKEDEI